MEPDEKVAWLPMDTEWFGKTTLTVELMSDPSELKHFSPPPVREGIIEFADGRRYKGTIKMEQDPTKEMTMTIENARLMSPDEKS
jgi:hypothetical protein